MTSEKHTTTNLSLLQYKHFLCCQTSPLRADVIVGVLKGLRGEALDLSGTNTWINHQQKTHAYWLTSEHISSPSASSAHRSLTLRSGHTEWRRRLALHEISSDLEMMGDLLCSGCCKRTLSPPTTTASWKKTTTTTTGEINLQTGSLQKPGQFLDYFLWNRTKQEQDIIFEKT